MSASERVEIPGSHRQLDPAHTRVGDADPQSEIDVTVYLRPRAGLDWVDEEAARAPTERRVVSRAQWADEHAASPDDAAPVRAFAHDHRLSVTNVDRARRAITLHGSLQALTSAFERQLKAATRRLRAPHRIGHRGDARHRGVRRRRPRCRDRRVLRPNTDQGFIARRLPRLGAPRAGLRGRGVPDVSADADPTTGYRVRADGQDQTVGGTSAVAPLWAGLIGLLNQAAGAPLGFVQPRLYPLLGSVAFHDITSGNNGSYSAGTGWDACTGLGSPDGAALAQQLTAAS